MAVAHSTTPQTREDRAIYRALKLLEGRMRTGGDTLTGPGSVRDYLRLLLGDEDREVFTVVFLNAQNRVITCEPMFYGTLTQTAVYPREVARRALHHNAAAVIFAHNHPSGIAEPSRADLGLTCRLMEVLRMFDVEVLDHFIVSGTGATSLMECGLLGMRDFPAAQPTQTRKKRSRKTKAAAE